MDIENLKVIGRIKTDTEIKIKKMETVYTNNNQIAIESHGYEHLINIHKLQTIVSDLEKAINSIEFYLGI